MHRRSLLAFLAVLPLAACENGNLLPAADRLDGACASPARLEGQPDPRLPDQYVVVFDSTTADPRGVAQRLAARHGFTPRHVYEHALKGFSAQMSPSAAAGVRCEAEVDYMAYDQVVSIN